MTWLPVTPLVEDLGFLQIVVVDGDGAHHDITSFRGAPVLVSSIVSNEPFGDASATLEFTQITPYEAPKRFWGEMPQLYIYIVLANTSKITLFQGFIASWDSGLNPDDWSTQAQCKGSLYQYDFHVMPPPITLPTFPIDVGTQIKDTLDRFHTRNQDLVAVSTGINTLKVAGAGQPVLTGYIQDLLGTAQQSDGGQWTLMLTDPDVADEAIRQPVLRLKDRTTVHLTIACGAPGTTHSLNQDETTGVTTYYGEGIDSLGCFWRNTKYPNLHAEVSPPYPGVALDIGVSDSESGNGVSLWEQRMHDNGHPGLAVTGNFNAADRAAAIALQTAEGIQVDGIVGPQTWTATFQTGSNQGDLEGAYFAPLYSDPRVEKWNYHDDGSRAGLRPTTGANGFDHTMIRREKWINFGTGVSKDLATRMCKLQYNRDRYAAWTGTINLAADPNEMSRFRIRPGMNILYQGFAGNVHAQGGAAQITSFKHTAGMALNEPIVGGAHAAAGYWLTAGDGGVFTFNGAAFHGSMAGTPLSAPIVGIAGVKGGGGYWLVGADGGVFAFGNAQFHGSLPGSGTIPSAPIVGIAEGPGVGSYYIVSAAGQVWGFPSSHWKGGLYGVAITLHSPIVGIESTLDGDGYYLLGADGGVFASSPDGVGVGGRFGDARTDIIAPALLPISTPASGMALNILESGYYFATHDGGVFSQGSSFYGSLGGTRPSEQIVDILVAPDGLSYRLVGADAETWIFSLDNSAPGVETDTTSGVFFHISQVEKNMVDQTVILTVDEKARDLMTVDAVYQRNRQANDPALRPHPYHMNSVQTFDNHPVFDCESGGGIIPNVTLQANLWSVIHVPVAATGIIGQMKIQAINTGAKLSMAVFDRPITANAMASHGNPLTSTDFWKSFDENSGLIIGWGSIDQPGGFSPGVFSNGDPPTGAIIDNASWYYQTTQSPWLWVALYSSVTTAVSGRLLPALGTG